MFPILFAKELRTSVNVLAYKPINKCILGIFRGYLKLRNTKKIGRNVCDAGLLCWKHRGITGVTTFFSSLFRNHKRRKITPCEAYHKKNITCEIRCLLLLPTSTCLLLFYPDYCMLRWCICDYWLISNKHQLDEKWQRKTWPLLFRYSYFSMTALAADTIQSLTKCIHNNSFPWYALISQKLLCKWRDRFVH